MPRQSIVQTYRAAHVAEIAQASHDKRTVSTTRAAARAASSDRSASYIADRLGISRQKWVAVRTGIEKGRIFGPEIRDKLRAIDQGTARPPERIRKEKAKEREKEKAAKPNLYLLAEGVRYTENSEQFKKLIPWAVIQKTEMTLQGLRNYLGPIPYAYFVVVRVPSQKQAGKYLYRIYDIRTPSELKKKGHLSGEPRAEKIFNEEFNYIDSDPEDL